MQHREPDVAPGPGSAVSPEEDPTAPSPHARPGFPELDLSELAPRCLAMLDWVRRTGGEVTITSRGRPVARLLPVGNGGEEDERVTWDIEAIAP